MDYETEIEDSILDMFTTDGWKHWRSELEKEVEILEKQAVYECETNEQWQIRRGIILTLKQILSKETIILLSRQSENDEYKHNLLED